LRQETNREAGAHARGLVAKSLGNGFFDAVTRARTKPAKELDAE
jgi:hypothetical protein